MQGSFGNRLEYDILDGDDTISNPPAAVEPWVAAPVSNAPDELSLFPRSWLDMGPEKMNHVCQITFDLQFL
jgi:hypothetical protein